MGKAEIIAQLKAHLQNEAVAGLPETWFVEPSKVVNRPHVVSSDVTADAASEQVVDPQQQWAALKATALSCTKCRLAAGRKNVVFGAGKTDTPLVAFIGEGPGAEEDAQGEPFVGKAGQLLTAAITKGMKLSRDEVYIANVVKCRPPENRTPLPDEVQCCSEYLFAQLALLQPKVIVALGGPAQKALCGIEQGITKLRGQWLEYNGIKVMPTFHPAYILRNPDAKKDFWLDLQEVMREIGIA